MEVCFLATVLACLFVVFEWSGLSPQAIIEMITNSDIIIEFRILFSNSILELMKLIFNLVSRSKLLN